MAGGVDAVLFDCWGTLFTTTPTVPMYAIADEFGLRVDAGFRDAYEAAFMLERHDGYARPTRELAAAVEVDVDAAAVERVVDRLETLNERQSAYDDTYPALEALQERGLALALVTNTDAASLRGLRREFGLEATFDAVVPSYEVGSLKPDPAIFEAALDRLGVPPSRVAMVGDSPGSDVAAAQRLGMRAVLVDRAGIHPDREPRVTGLADLLGRL